MWGAIIKPALNLISTTIEGKQEIKRAEIDAKVRRQSDDASWEIEQARASANSWKDELWTVLFVSIIAACFIPWTQPFVSDGFAYLETTPVWFQVAVGSSIAASFGVKTIERFKR